MRPALSVAGPGREAPCALELGLCWCQAALEREVLGGVTEALGFAPAPEKYKFSPTASVAPLRLLM